MFIIGLNTRLYLRINLTVLGLDYMKEFLVGQKF